MSSEVVIRLEGLGKRYRLGEFNHNRSLRQQFGKWLSWPLHRGQRKGGAAAAASEPESERRDLWALRDLSFDIQRGDVVGFVGSNGAGKSTLLKILARIIVPTEGNAEIRGRVGSLLEVGTGFHQELTGRENIFLNGAILGMNRGEIRKKFDEIVDFAGIEAFLDTPVKRYSSGMAVRLAFAVAAHLDPEILILDEVLAVGDAEFQRKCLGKMGDVARDGRTVLFVSHNLSAVQRLCQRAIYLKKGVVEADGPCCDVVRGYLEDCGGRQEGVRNSYTAPDSPYDWIDCQINDSPAGRAVALVDREPLRLSVLCGGREPGPPPRLDIVLYRHDHLKVFSFATDRMLADAGGDGSRRWRFDLRFDQVALAPSHYYLDIGVRSEEAGKYQMLWKRACDLVATGSETAAASDAIILPAVEGSIRPAAAEELFAESCAGLKAA